MKYLFALLTVLVYAHEPEQDASSNAVTIHSYELSIDEYIARTPAEVGTLKTWIDATLNLLPPHPHIIEIGSAFGRDADYMESLGFEVERTDATEGFVNLLQQNGHAAYRFNILTDEFSSQYDLIFANAVFLHFKPKELQKALVKIGASLEQGGLLAFSVKQGEGEEWTTAKLGQPRYFCYWSADTICSLLESAGFEITTIFEDDIFLQIIARRRG